MSCSCRTINKKRYRNNDAATKLEAVEWASKYKSIKSAAKKFKVDRKRIKEWTKKEEELKQQVSNTSRGSKRKRLDGGGRQVNNSDLDEELAEWIREKRENKQPDHQQQGNGALSRNGTQDFGRLALVRITVCLTASSDGRKLLLYVLVNRKRPVPAIVKKFEKKLIINWNGSVWMNNETTADYLTQVIKAGGVFSGKRLLVWDAFAAHKSEATLAVLKELGVEAAFIPGGCTKFIQALDVSWNKPLKERIRQYYTMWMTNDARKEYTAGGNQKAPALDIVLDWVDRAWQELSKEIIIKSFKACALSTATDGTEDDQITCFKQTGSIGIKGLDLLHKIRAQNMARDGRNDYEEAGLLEEGKLEEEQPERTEETLDEFNEDGYFMFVEQFGV